MTNNPNYPAAILANFDGDYRQAYDHLAKVYLALEQQFSDSITSRFVEISRFEDNGPCVRKVTESEISNAVDMADCLPEPEMRQWLYLDDKGTLQPVTVGVQRRYSSGVEMPFRYAESWLVAGGKAVGEVVYTDH